MKVYTLEEAKNMTLEEAQLAINRAVYEASKLVETLEHAGKCVGNGHHARQKLAGIAAEEVAARWK